MSGSSPTSRWEQQLQYISRTIQSRLDRHPAWPRTAFRLELEKVEIYQDRSNSILSDLESDGVIGRKSVRIGSNDIDFITRPLDPPPDPDDEIREATRQLNEFFGESSDFSELAAYTAICKVCDELRGGVDGIDAYPSGNYPHVLDGFESQVDALLMIPGEKIPVEVYNGSDYLSVEIEGHESKKHRQIRERYQEAPLSHHPMLINRRSDNKFKKNTRNNYNSVTIDTDMIIGCRETHTGIEDAIGLLNLDRIIQLFPRLETASGHTLNGEEFIDATRQPGGPGMIQPVSEMTQAAETLPDQYVRRIRGGVHLHYVNMFFRRASEDDRTSREASFVLQQIYNQLLHEGGMIRKDALDYGWNEFTSSYRNVKSARQREEAIRDRTNSYLNQLIEENVAFQRDSQIYARSSEHPQPSFTSQI